MLVVSKSHRHDHVFPIKLTNIYVHHSRVYRPYTVHHTPYMYAIYNEILCRVPCILSSHKSVLSFKATRIWYIVHTYYWLWLWLPSEGETKKVSKGKVPKGNPIQNREWNQQFHFLYSEFLSCLWILYRVLAYSHMQT